MVLLPIFNSFGGNFRIPFFNIRIHDCLLAVEEHGLPGEESVIYKSRGPCPEEDFVRNVSFLSVVILYL